MDKRSIGVFDSGLGGLTVVSEIMKQIPNENIVYFGDTARVPYGTRSKDTIKKYALQDTKFLLSFDAKIIVVACGTVSSTALDSVKESCNVPVFGVIDSAVIAAAKATKNSKIGILGTNATISSGAFERKLRKFNDFELTSVACPLFVPLVENGRFKVGDSVAETVVLEYLNDIIKNNCDTLILGCTHYPLLTDIISTYLPNVTLINPGKETAISVNEYLSKENMQNNSNMSSQSYFVSDSIHNFSNIASICLGKTFNNEVKKINIEEY